MKSVLLTWLASTVALSCSEIADPKQLENPSEALGSKSRRSLRPGEGVQFSDATATSGIDFVHVSGTLEQLLILESMSGGAAFFDYDADGWLDLYLVNGTRVELEGADPPISRLYRNIPGSTNARSFTDATTPAGVGLSGWGMGVAAADYDNDGDVDLYVTNWGENVLFSNDGAESFADVTEETGVGDDGWSASAAFGDLDNDGWLDLYVTNYVVFDLESPPNDGALCEAYKGIEGFCGPKDMEFQADVLYRNREGAFQDASRSTGVSDVVLPGLGVVFADYDDDGDQDIYVANDTKANLLWRNDGGWRLSEVGTESGAAFSASGKPQSGMGVDVGDYDNDGDLDIFVTNFADEFNTIYQNESDGSFTDTTGPAGLAGAAAPFLGWSTAFFDADNDTWQDLFVANGHLYPGLEGGPTPLRYPQRNILYWNDESAYVLAGRESGPALEIEKVSRGAAFGDYDNDGDIDIIVVNLNDTPTLLRNDGGNTNNWLGLELKGSDGNTDALGARVTLFAGGKSQTQEVRRGYGYQSAQDHRLLFGLGSVAIVDSIVVRWPSGEGQVFSPLPIRRYHVLLQSHPQSNP